MKVRCLSNRSSDDRTHRLGVGEVYEVIALEADEYRIIDDSGEPVLFEPDCFEIVDPHRPPTWVCTVEDGVEYASPPEFAAPGFWEDYFEHDPAARTAFSRFLNRHLRLGAA